MAQSVVVHEALNRDPNPGPMGEKPYEMADRQEEHVPLVAFDDASGWQVEGSNAEAWLYRSQDRKLYRDYCGKLVYLGKGDNPSLVVRPERPIPIPEPWDAVNLWTWGNNWGWIPDPTTPPLHAAAVVRDAAGQVFEIRLGYIDYQYWFLMNGRLHPAEVERMKRPCVLLGLRFTNATNTEKRAIYLGPCYFFKEDLEPLTFAPWPEKLPFPTRPETILPANKTAQFTNAARKEGNAFIFSYQGEDCSLEYRYVPTHGTLGDIELRYAGKSLRPCAGGGLQLAGAHGTIGPEDKGVQRTLKEQGLVGDLLTLVWHLEGTGVNTDVTYRMRIAQKSLIVEIEAGEPVVERVSLGRAEPVEQGKLFRVPFLTYGEGDPRVLYADGLFLFTQFDWYYSEASALVAEAKMGTGWAIYNGGAHYIPNTDGRRNSVRERVFITASPDFQEVLPTIPNPPSPFGETQGERLWRVKMGGDYHTELAEAAKLRNYGCDKVTIRYHEDTWRDAGESFTFRLEAAPKRGGDEALRKFVADIQALGWRVGLYTNYCDYAPVSKRWDEDMVIRLPNGDWQRAWPRCYAPKPMYGVEMEAKLAPQIQAKFGENHSYCDVHTCVSPFDRVDYDARVPGAATFRRTFECFGRLLHNEKFAHKGPVYSEGTNHWWYAGLTDGNYGQINDAHPSQVPLLVDFDLLKMHPLEMDVGMGAPDMFFRNLPRSLDQFIATTVAYGHIGFFDWPDLAGALKIYYMMQQLQKRYVMTPVRTIAYAQDGELVDSSRALISDAYRGNRVHVVYENGTEVYVNGSAEEWVVKGPDRDYTLARWGYLAWRPGDDIMVYSAVVPAAGPGEPRGPRRRVDCSLSTEQCYADSRGGFAFLGRLALEGSAALKKDGEQWWVIPTTDCRDFAFSPSLIGLGEGESVEVTAVAEDGSAAPAPDLRWSRGLVHVIPTSAVAFKYEVRRSDRRRPPVVDCASTIAAVGSTVRAVLPAGLTAAPTEIFWECEGKRFPADGSIEDRAVTCSVPADLRAGQHLWLGISAPSQTLWLDFVVVDACQLSLELPSSASLRKGESLRGSVEVMNNLDQAVTLPIRVSASRGAVCRAEAKEVKLQGAEHASVETEIQLPWADGSYDISSAIGYGGRTMTAACTLEAELTRPVLMDLSDPETPYTRGYRLRGQGEMVGGETMYDGSFYPMKESSGGVTRAGLFAHPPWGDQRSGYAFAMYDLELPESSPIFFEFWMGMRDGYAPTDGVTYKVVVIDKHDSAVELFSHHHQAFRWQRARVDLSAFAGKAVELKLIADCGPRDDTVCDHALWGEPRVVLYAEDRASLLVRRCAEMMKTQTR